MIISGLTGGLGNQMFQYAMGYRFAHDRKAPYRLDISRLTDITRPYALNHLCIEALPLPEAEAKKFQPRFPRLQRKLPWLKRLIPQPIRHIYEQQWSFDSSVLELPLSAYYFEGYWQTEKYFATVADAIRRQFQLIAPMTAPRHATAGLIKDKNAVSVHVRRGDYVSNAMANAFHGTCSPQWYEGAMTKMAGLVEAPHFFVFSDDPGWARANLPQQWPTDFVDPQTDRRDFEDMHLMALCRHHIIANSSYSWWGAWLNPSPDKCVMAPLQWFANAPHDTRDVTPPSWTRM